jgi:hypothetical protein
MENIFLPWKVLKAFDLGINGGINFTGLESLQKVEDLETISKAFCHPSRVCNNVQ